MKKLAALTLVAALAVSALAGCSGSTGAHTGYSVHTSISSSADAAADKAGKAQVDTIIVYTTIGKDGKILNTQVESAQTAVPFDAKGQIPADYDVKGPQKTKTEKGEEYGMKKNSAIGKEWNEQADAFAKWAVGKTVADATGIQTKKVDDHHTRVPDVADLASSVTIDVGEFLDGVAAASQNPILGEDLPKGFKTGLGVVTTAGKSKSATAEGDGLAQVDSVFAIVSLDSKGKIVELRFDNAQTKINFNVEGKVTSDKAVPAQSKQQLKEGYGMLKASGIGKEWYQQADAFAQWCIGKTLDEVKGLKTKKVDDSHPMVPDISELASSVTISVGDYIAALEKAVANAK